MAVVAWMSVVVAWVSGKECLLIVGVSEGSLSGALISDLLVGPDALLLLLLLVLFLMGGGAMGEGVGVCAWPLALRLFLELSDLSAW